ncbi:hypothetical protein SAMN04489832_4565 [Micromonospora cremea]|uniref:CopC domain-containing protein n=2 Tax=Micromonospora cremea TaxID=709881 RepID=A0A1N5ZWK8_9ACTN|nr:hypothetical protein SAMN04489832_4565 [Micromonospora cremea]
MGTARKSRIRAARKRGASRVPGLILFAMLVVGLLAVDMTAADPAVAHSDLKSASPAAGSVTKAAPAAVGLVFNEGVLSASLTVTDGCGRTVPAQVTVRGRNVQATLRPGDQAPPSGAWSVRWRAVSEDGHPISGTVPFTVAGTTNCASSASRDDSPSVTATAAADGTDTQDTAVAVSSESGTFPTNIVLALAVVLLGAGAAVLASRRRGPPVPTRNT